MPYRRYDYADSDDAEDDVYYMSDTEYRPRRRHTTNHQEPRTYIILETYEDVDPSIHHRGPGTARGKRRQTHNDSDPTGYKYYAEYDDNGSSPPSASYNGEGSSRDGARNFSSDPDPPPRYAAHHPGSRTRQNHNSESSSRARRYASNPDPRHTSADYHSGSRSYHRSERKPLFFCWSCQKSFANAEEKLEHRANSSRHFLCRLCNDNMDYERSSGLERHYKNNHQAQFCEFCAKVYPTESAKLNHMDANHSLCKPCGVYLADAGYRNRHWARSSAHRKEYCMHCRNIYPDLIAHARRHHSYSRKHASEEHAHKPRDNGHGSYREERTPREKPHPRSSTQTTTGAHYVTLCVEPSAHQDDIVRAAKKRRIETHPDRLKRKPGLTERQKAKIDEEAAKVGHAADILSDPVSRLLYDQDVRAGRAQ